MVRALAYAPEASVRACKRACMHACMHASSTSDAHTRLCIQPAWESRCARDGAPNGSEGPQACGRHSGCCATTSPLAMAVCGVWASNSHVAASGSAPSRTLAIPKSPSFAWPAAVRKTFCVLRSRWRTPRSWTWCSASANCAIHDSTWSSVNGRDALRTREPRSPPSPYSMTRQRCSSSTKVSRYPMTAV